MSERKVVMLPDFSPVAGKEIKGFGTAEIKELIDYFEMIPEGSMLLITYSEQQETKSKKSKIKTAAEKIGRVYDFQPLKMGN